MKLATACSPFTTLRRIACDAKSRNAMAESFGTRRGCSATEWSTRGSGAWPTRLFSAPLTLVRRLLIPLRKLPIEPAATEYLRVTGDSDGGHVQFHSIADHHVTGPGGCSRA